MVLGAFLDAGLPLDELKRALGSLAVPGLEIAATRVLRAGIAATKFRVIEAPQMAGVAAGHHHEHSQGHTPHAGEPHAHGSADARVEPAHHAATHPHRSVKE